MSRTVTAPFDRIKVYLIAQTELPNATKILSAAAKAHPLVGAKVVAGPIRECIQTLWRTGGVRSFFAGMLSMARAFGFFTHSLVR